MPVILGLLAAISAIAFFIWRMRAAAEAASEIASAADDVRGKVHYWFFRRNYNKHPLQLIDDPREAAAALMVAVAQDDGVISEAELNEVNRHMRATLMVEDAVATLARARWAVRDVKNLDDCAAKLIPMFRKKLDPRERGELIDMLQGVAGADGAVSEAHRTALTRWRQALQQR